MVAGGEDYPDGVHMYVVFQDVVSIYGLNGNLPVKVLIECGPGMELGQQIP